MKMTISRLEKEISDLYVVIETLQTNMKSATSYLDKEESAAVMNHSFKWCMNWKPGDQRELGPGDTGEGGENLGEEKGLEGEPGEACNIIHG